MLGHNLHPSPRRKRHQTRNGSLSPATFMGPFEPSFATVMGPPGCQSWDHPACCAGWSLGYLDRIAPGRLIWRSAGMVFREVQVVEVREVLRAWLAGKGLRTVAGRAGVDRKTARRYVDAAVAAGLSRDGGEEQLTDELVGRWWRRCARRGRTATARRGRRCWAEQQQIVAWVERSDLTVVKIGTCWPVGVWWCRTGRCTGSRWSACGFRAAVPGRRSGSRRGAGGGVPARLRPAGLDRSTRRPGGAGWCTR